MRNCIVYRMVRDPDATKIHRPMIKEVRGPAIFHTFGIDWDDLGDHIQQRTSAIVEFPDGTCDNVSLYLIQFSEPTQLPADLVASTLDLATDTHRLMLELCSKESNITYRPLKESIGNLLAKSAATIVRFKGVKALHE